MKKILLAAIALIAATTFASADIIDPLHGVCEVGCVANGTNITIPNPPLNFGFEASPAQTSGTLTMDFLVPVADGVPSSITVTGSANGALTFTANLFSTTPWTSGQLDTYLGISANPTNTLDAIQHSGQGFFVVQGVAGTYTIPQQGTPLPDSVPLWSVAGGVPENTAILGFLSTSSGILATANSSVLQVPGPAAGAGIPGLIAGCLGMVALARRRINKWRVA